MINRVAFYLLAITFGPTLLSAQVILLSAPGKGAYHFIFDQNGEKVYLIEKVRESDCNEACIDRTGIYPRELNAYTEYMTSMKRRCSDCKKRVGQFEKNVLFDCNGGPKLSELALEDQRDFINPSFEPNSGEDFTFCGAINPIGMPPVKGYFFVYHNKQDSFYAINIPVDCESTCSTSKSSEQCTQCKTNKGTVLKRKVECKDIESTANTLSDDFRTYLKNNFDDRDVKELRICNHM